MVMSRMGEGRVKREGVEDGNSANITGLVHANCLLHCWGFASLIISNVYLITSQHIIILCLLMITILYCTTPYGNDIICHIISEKHHAQNLYETAVHRGPESSIVHVLTSEDIAYFISLI